MPKLARLDAPGVLHHVMGRGIERVKFFTRPRIQVKGFEFKTLERLG